MHGHSPGVVLRSLVIGLTAFLTVVDLFATQAILPSLARHYNVTPAAMGFAVNASTMGMAVAGLVVGFLSPHIDRRLGILLSLVLLAIPTTLLAVAPDLTVFTILRIMQGLCMASAFALTLAYLGEQCSSMDAGGAFAAYITGNVASNLIGRLVSAAVVDNFGLASNFYFFALLNLAGAVLVYFTIQRVQPMHAMPATQSPVRGHDRPLAQPGAPRRVCDRLLHPVRLHRHLHLREFRAGAAATVARADGSRLCLFRVPALRRHDAVCRQGGRTVRHAAGDLGRARRWPGIGLPLMLSSHLAGVLTGMVLVGVGTFFAQASATGFVGQAAQQNRGVASGTYLACYFLGGLVGTAVLGQLFDRLGWLACVAGVAASLVAAAWLTTRLALTPPPVASPA